jgi:hypothetical protein
VNSTLIDPRISTTFSELYIPARALPNGIFELKLVVSMVNSSHATSTISAYVRIVPAGMIANLVQLGTSMITIGDQQDLQLNPGLYSIDLDEDVFNASVSNFIVFAVQMLTSTSVLGLAISILLSKLWVVIFSQYWWSLVNDR